MTFMSLFSHVTTDGDASLINKSSF